MALLPTLREKKRYIAFEVISERPVTDPSLVTDTVHHAVQRYLGQKGAAEAGVIVIKDRYDPLRQRGIIRVTHTNVIPVTASLCFIERMQGVPVIVKTLGTSGILKKALSRYMAS